MKHDWYCHAPRTHIKSHLQTPSVFPISQTTYLLSEWYLKSLIYQPVSPTTELCPYFQHKQNQYITQGTTVNTPVIYHNQGIIKDLSLQDTFVFQDYTLQLMLVTNRSTSRRSYTFHPDKPSCNHLQSYIRMIPFAQLPFANQSTSHRGIIPLLWHQHK